MSKIYELSNYLQETAIQKFTWGEASSVVPPEDRIYLNSEGLIPNVNKKPMDLKPPILVIEGKQGGLFIDKRMLLKFHPEEFESAHAPEDNLSYGGIITNTDGMILMRKPKDEFGGQKWTFAKGGANEGESPEEAALREVEEETGIKGKIISEIPGHYNSTNSSNKYFLMEADIDDDHIDSFKSDETDELKWMTSAEAMNALDDNENEETSTRDKEVLSTALHITSENSNSTFFNGLMNDDIEQEKETEEENIEEVIKHYSDHGVLPENLNANPYTHNMVADLSVALLSGKNTLNYPDLADFFPRLFTALDEKYSLEEDAGFNNFHTEFIQDWKKSASKGSHEVNLLQERVGAKENIPHTFLYGKRIPEDTDVLGKPTYRDDKQRDEIIDLYQKWKNKELDPSGKFSWGEAYNFNAKEKVGYSHQTKDGEVVTNQTNPYRLMFERAKSVKVDRDGVISESARETRANILRNYGKSFIEGVLKENIDDYDDAGIQEEGNNFLDAYIDHMRAINKPLLDAAFPDSETVTIWRKTDGISELFGTHGVQGLEGKEAGYSNIRPEHFGLMSNASASEGGFQVKAHSAPLSGGSVNPKAWAGNGDNFALATKVNKNDVLILHPMLYSSKQATGGYQDSDDFNTEYETVYIPKASEADTRVIYHDSDHKYSNHWKADSEADGWTFHGSGFAPKNLFKTAKDMGVTNWDTDYYDEGILTPATSEDSPFVTLSNEGQLGSNSGRLTKDENDKLFYIKTENSARNKSEVFATNLYKEAGIPVPNMELINYNGSFASKSEWLPNPITHTAYSNSPPEQLLNSPDVKDGFFVDVLLGNYDVAGANYDNIVESNGRMYRVDNGGTFQHRAKSKELKQNYNTWEGDYVEELSSMMDTQYNSGKIFSTMTDDDIKRAANNLFKLTNSKIKSIAKSSGFSTIEFLTLASRRESIFKWLVDNKSDVINHSSVDSIKDEYNILKSEILKEDSVEREIPDIFVGDTGRQAKQTPEEQKATAEHNERLSRIYEKEWERVFADDDQ